MASLTIAQQVAKVRAECDAAKIVAMARFEKDWGTRDVRKVAEALRTTIPGSASPIDAAIKARLLVARS